MENKVEKLEEDGRRKFLRLFGAAIGGGGMAIAANSLLPEAAMFVM